MRHLDKRRICGWHKYYRNDKQSIFVYFQTNGAVLHADLETWRILCYKAPQRHFAGGGIVALSLVTAEALQLTRNEMKRKAGGSGRVLAVINKSGNVGFSFDTLRMKWTTIDVAGTQTARIGPLHSIMKSPSQS